MATEVLKSGGPASERRVAPGRAWLVEPILTVISYSAFLVYATWAVFSGTIVFFDPYVSPFDSTWLGFGVVQVPVIGLLLPILAVIPLGLRASCYYYRKSYFRSFFWDPPACAIREARRGHYTGESRFPFVLNNFHRYFLILSVIVIIFLWVDVVRAFAFHGHFFIGLGSGVMLVNVILLSLYTFSCHSFRHLAGGGVDCYSCVFAGRLRHRVAAFLSWLNPTHGAWAWYSMFSVALTDLYIRLLMAGVISEPRWVL